jgi:hypothetical protein
LEGAALVEEVGQMTDAISASSLGDDRAAYSLSGMPAFEQLRQGSKRIEMLFAHFKRILRMGRLRLRGPCGAQDEFPLAATAQNLRKLAKLTVHSDLR